MNNCKKTSSSLRGLVGRIVARSQPSILRGTNAWLETQVLHSGSGDPYAYRGLVGATAQFLSSDNVSAVSVVGSLVSADLGRVRFDLPPSGTMGLAIGSERDFQQVFEDDSGVTIIPFRSAVSIEDPMFYP